MNTEPDKLVVYGGPGKPGNYELECVSHPDPRIGYKLAGVDVDGCFLPQNGTGARYQAGRMEATCLLWSPHGGFLDHFPKCSCGFWAHSEPTFPGGTFGAMRGKALLAVELSGRVIEYERGYRAQYQRILRITFPHVCACGCECKKPATRLAIAHFGRIVPSCARCKNPNCEQHTLPTITPAELAGKIGTEVIWRPRPRKLSRDKRLALASVTWLVLSTASLVFWGLRQDVIHSILNLVAIYGTLAAYVMHLLREEGRDYNLDELRVNT